MLTPIMIKKLLGCIQFNISKLYVAEKMAFNLVDLGIKYKDEAPICVNDMWYTYDYIGILNESIDGRIDCHNITLYGTDGVTVTDDFQTYQIYNNYLGKSDISCCKSSDKMKFVEKKIQFVIVNLVINLQGTIGGEPFLGSYTYTGPVV